MKHILAATLAILATQACAESQHIWGNEIRGNAPPGMLGYQTPPSILDLGPPTVEGAVATITFENTMVHSEDEEVTLVWNDIVVNFAFGFNVDALGAERVTAFPPDGYIARPPEVTVQEDTTGTIHIYEYLGF